MEEWGIWSEDKRGDGTIIGSRWWADKSNRIFHTTTREVALAQLKRICGHWLGMAGVGHFSVKSFQTGEVIRAEHPGLAFSEWLYQAAMRWQSG